MLDMSPFPQLTVYEIGNFDDAARFIIGNKTLCWHVCFQLTVFSSFRQNTNPKVAGSTP